MLDDRREPPRVSCVCVTRGKPARLRRAVQCFAAQRYAHKELVLVYEDDDAETGALARSLADAHAGSIVAIEVAVAPKRTLGELRNIGIQRASGEFFCQWDDDDWYHVDRLALQVDATLANRRKACLLTNWIIHDEVTRRSYFSCFRLWEGSVLCRRDVLGDDLRYPALSKQEDSHFTRALAARGHVFPLVAAGLYIYTAHEGNTWPRAHFERMFALSQRLGDSTSALVADILDGRYDVAEASALIRGDAVLDELRYFTAGPTRADTRESA